MNSTMRDLVLLASVFIILNGFVYSYPSWSFNHNTNKKKPAELDESNGLTLGPMIDKGRVILGYVTTTPPPRPEDGEDEKFIFISKESENVQNKKKKTWKSKMNQLNKWRLPIMENQDLPTVFILRNNAYKELFN